MAHLRKHERNLAARNRHFRQTMNLYIKCKRLDGVIAQSSFDLFPPDIVRAKNLRWQIKPTVKDLTVSLLN
jgi:hypothetical protein